jgi:hypothetical protein
MKKLVFAFAAIVAVSFASCGGNTAATEVAADSTDVDTVAVDTVAVDTVAADTTVVAE